MILALLLVPIVAGILVFFSRNRAIDRTLLIVAATAHAGMTASTWFSTPPPLFFGWLALDAPGKLFLGITSSLFLAASFYAVGYLRREAEGRKQDLEEGFAFSNVPEQIFVGALLFFLAT